MKHVGIASASEQSAASVKSHGPLPGCSGFEDIRSICNKIENGAREDRARAETIFELVQP